MRLTFRWRAIWLRVYTRRKRLIHNFSLIMLLLLAGVGLMRGLRERRNNHRLARQAREMSSWRSMSLINLPGCSLPYVDPANPVILNDWFHSDGVTRCRKQKRNIFHTEVRGDRTCPRMSHEILLDDYGVLPHQVECEYRTVRHDPDEAVMINSVKYSEKKPLRGCPDEDLIWITCSINGMLYEQALFTVIDVPRKEDRVFLTGNREHFNVLVLGIDSVSRLNFHRTFSETFQTILSIYGNDAVELLAFNKVGLNSAPNQIPFLTGKRFRHETDLNEGEYADNYSRYIWDDFTEAGYSTLFAEEQMEFGLFVYPNRKGFRSIPSDFWPRPLMLAQSGAHQRSYIRPDGLEYCLGGELASASVLRFWLDAQRISHRPLFSYVWLSELTHDSLTGGKDLDPLISDLFADWGESFTNKTVVLFLSDHGFRGAPFRETPLGKLEDSLPFGWILLPPWFRNKYPEEVARLRENAGRLVTPYDIHSTLLSLASIASNRSGTSSKRSQPLGLSLLDQTVPPERTCRDAGIDTKYCSCYSGVEIEKNQLTGTLIAEKVVTIVNEILELSNATNCALLHNPIVRHLEQVRDNNSTTFFKITVEAEPGAMKLEAFFEHHGESQFSIEGLPDRLDRYGLTSQCAKNTAHEKYCRCKVL